jgi:hypothetical protein
MNTPMQPSTTPPTLADVDAGALRAPALHARPNMKYLALAFIASVCFACVDSDPPKAPPPADADPSQAEAIEDTEPDETIDADDSMTESVAPGTIEQWDAGGEDDHRWYYPFPFPWHWPWGHGHKTARWICDVTCNVQPTERGARCPDRVTGKGIGTSSDSACRAAKNDANTKPPRKCYKRHCNCRCTKATETHDHVNTPSSHD